MLQPVHVRERVNTKDSETWDEAPLTREDAVEDDHRAWFELDFEFLTWLQLILTGNVKTERKVLSVSAL